MMKWAKKYLRSSFNKKEILAEIEQHRELLYQTNVALDVLEQLTLDGEEHWLEDASLEMECALDNIKIKKDKKNGSFSGSASAHCHS